MSSNIFIVEPDRRSLETILLRGVKETGATSLGLAVAYVSVYGAKFVKRLVSNTAVAEVRLIVDIRDGISHPQALKMALDESWSVRAVNRKDGTFHPKVFIAGEKFVADGTAIGVRLYFIGSSNLTNGGLNRNIECGVVNTCDDPIVAAGAAFKALWSLGTDFDENRLDQYELYFAERNRSRSPDDLRALGVADELEQEFEASSNKLRRSATPILTPRVASVAWAGLES
jgi:phosphatidylserine/phosphatidylglycerophosphate/cardiolipin synthase-like enzyme